MVFGTLISLMACSYSCLVWFSRALLGAVQERLLCYIFHSAFHITGTPTTRRPAKSATPKISLEYLCILPTYFAPGVLTPPQLEFPLALQAIVQRETPEATLHYSSSIFPWSPARSILLGCSFWRAFEGILEVQLVALREASPGCSAWLEFEPYATLLLKKL